MTRSNLYLNGGDGEDLDFEATPTTRRGNFTWHDGMQKWVWTTFNTYQWDLNYRNPAVFRAMAEEMFFIANTGVDVLRLVEDAIGGRTYRTSEALELEPNQILWLKRV